MKKKEIFNLIIITIVILAIGFGVWQFNERYIISLEGTKLISCREHIDKDSDMLCDVCHSKLPFSNYAEYKNIESGNSGENKVYISGYMPKEAEASISKISNNEAVVLAKKYKSSILDEDVISAFDISINSNNIKYQPIEYSQKVNVKLSNLDLNPEKTYALLHIIDDDNYEILPISEVRENEICFTTGSFSTYIIITVGTNTLTFDGENFKVLDAEGNEITNGANIASDTAFNFNIVPNDGYGVTGVTCNLATGDSAISIVGDIKGRSCNIASVSEDLTINVTTVVAPSITTQPESVKVKQGTSAKYTVVAENATKYQWQYRENKDTYWKDVTSTLGSGYSSATFTLTNTLFEISGYEFRCLVGNDNFTAHERVVSDIATVSVCQDDIVVGETPIIMVQPNMDNAKVEIDTGKATYSVTAMGTDLTFTWQYRENRDTYWKSMTSSVGSSSTSTPSDSTDEKPLKTSKLTTATALYTLSGYEFRCLVGNKFYSNHDAVKSDIVAISAADNDIAIQAKILDFSFTAQPESQKVKLGEKATFTVEATGAGSYKWQYNLSGDSFWYDVTSSMSSTYNKASMTIDTSTMSVDENLNLVDSLSGTKFRCVASSSSVSGYTKTSDVAILSVAQGSEYIDNVKLKTDISSENITVTISNKSVEYSGSQHTPSVIVKDGETVLNLGTDYTVSYGENINVGVGSITINGAGVLYGGSRTETFLIVARAITIKPEDATKTYDGTALTCNVPEVSVGSLVSGHSVTIVTSGSQLNAGTSTNSISSVVIMDAGGVDVTSNYNITKATGNLTVTSISSVTFTVTPDITTTIYTGSEIKPGATVKAGDKELVLGEDYTISYTNNINVGTATIVATGKGNYEGSSGSVTFTIEKKAIELTAGSSSREYNGSPLTSSMVTVTSGSLVSGHTLTATTSGTITNVGSVSNTIVTYGIYCGAEEVTSNYDVTLKAGTLTITNASITGSLVMEGTNRVGKTLIANVSVEPNDCALTYKWYTNTTNSTTGGTEISGTTGNTLMLIEDMLGKYIYVVVTASKTNYATTELKDITDSMNNEFDIVAEKLSPILMGESFTNVFTNKYILGNSEITQRREDILTITIQDNQTAPAGAIATWDVSRDKNGSVTAWLVPNASDSTKYDLYICGYGGVIASSGSWLFSNYPNCTTINGLDKLDTSSVTSMFWMFDTCNNLKNLDVTSFNTSSVTTMNHMFAGCKNLTSLDVTNFNTRNVTDMSNMFSNCDSLTSLDVTNFDTSSVTNMSYMFINCINLTSLNVTNFRTGKVTDMQAMFTGCKNLTTSLDVTNFDTSNVTDMGSMFEGCIKLSSLDVTNFNTSSVTDMSNMFSHCNSLTSLDVTNFDTSSVTDMNEMFRYCIKLTSLDVTNFDTSSVKSMVGMFEDCANLTSLDLTNFNTSSVTDMSWMFFNCSSLKSIHLGPNFDKLNGSSMFSTTTNLTAIIAQSETPMTLSTDTGVSTSTILYVPNTTVETVYEAATNYNTVFGNSRIRPILELVGNDYELLHADSTYSDAGATVAGFNDANAVNYTQYGYALSTKGLPLDTSKIGIYTITYELKYTDKNGTSTVMTVYRDVEVYDDANISSVKINGGASSTKNIEVVIQVDATNADYMYISNTNVAPSDSDWVEYAKYSKHKLTTGNGSKTVYVWCKNENGSATSTMNASINLDASYTLTLTNKQVYSGSVSYSVKYAIKADGGTYGAWQDSNVFNGLVPNTIYYAKTKIEDAQGVSEESDELKFRVVYNASGVLVFEKIN